MSKNILLLMGSPRIKGNTDLLADAFVEGAKTSGNNITKINVTKNKIGSCLNCGYCKKHNGECVLKDGMEEVYTLLSESDIIVFATPLYYYGFSSQLKAVIDRFHAKSSVGGIEPKESMLLSVGADDESAFKPLIVTYQAILDYLKWEDKGILIVDNTEEKDAIKNTDGLERAKKLGLSIN